MLSGAERCASSVRDRQPGVNEGTMKKSLNRAEVVNQVDADEILPEYDFSRAAPNKYASRYTKGSAVVALDPDLAAAFQSSGKANEALRPLGGITQRHRSRRPASPPRS